MDDQDSKAPETVAAPVTLGALAAMPWELTAALYDSQVRLCRSVWGYCLLPGFPPHEHETPEQLEIPDPIEAAGEDLFA